MPAAVINNARCKCQNQHGKRNVKNKGTRVDEPAREGAYLLRDGYVMESRSGGKLTPQFGNSPHEVVDDDGAGANNAGNNLAPGQGGTQQPERNEETP